jgi:hypothetical protein
MTWKELRRWGMRSRSRIERERVALWSSRRCDSSSYSPACPRPEQGKTTKPLAPENTEAPGVARPNVIRRELHRFFSRPSGNFEPALNQELLGIAACALKPAMLFPAADTSTGRTPIQRRDGKVFGLGHPIITVVQPTQSILGKQATRG